jgi:putative transcriptional regulator
MAKKKNKEPLRLNRLRVILADRGISQTEFAEMMDVHPSKISRIYNNRTEPPLQLLYKMAQILKIEVAELLTPISNLQDHFPFDKSKEK